MAALIKSVTGAQFAAMFISGAAAVENARQMINEMNVFPVPDGDTGINMSLTMNTAVAELRKNACEGVGMAAEIIAGGLLRGARGNSGVILSLLFRGFSKHVKDLSVMDGADFALALADGVDAAYRAVMKPSEGTILTVSRVCAQKAKEYALEDNAVESVLIRALATAHVALEETVEQNPVLKKAGVIDAGAKGFCVLLEGMLAALQGDAITVENPQSPSGKPASGTGAANFSEYAAEDIRFAYCTEFIILRKPTRRDPIKLRALLGSLGDSLVFVDDEQIIKVHVHTNNPGKALESALDYGALSAVKIENMREQHTEAVIRQADAPSDALSAREAEPTARYGLVSVCAGEGVAAVMKDLGVGKIVSGGQTMNPSTEDILSAVKATPAETVFVFPNNKNIIMAAEQSAGLTSKEVIVIPSRSVPHGIAALLAFDPALDAHENREAMLSAMSAVSAGSVTYAARESVLDGNTVSRGDYMALLDGQLVHTSKDLGQVLSSLGQVISKKEPSYITVFYGENIAEKDAREAADLLAGYCPSAETHVLYGGQPVYYYLISAE
ncbi:MAG: DAK2 domain-containing protein [Oscillospiraceae bacterium]|nr:DAK2 domain-containing protein [Oscillospiraceae bacterium]